MTDVQLFMFPDNDAELRVVMIDGEPWFVAADVCAILGIGVPTNSIRYLDDDEHQTIDADTLPSKQTRGRTSRNPRVVVVSEPGLYSLILRSRKPAARAFKRWITHEVVPALRKTGRFEVAPKELTRKEIIQMALEAEEAREAAELRATEAERVSAEANAELDRQAPIITALKTMIETGESFDLRDTAQLLASSLGVSVGRTRLTQFLASSGWISKDVEGRWRAYQRFIDNQYLANPMIGIWETPRGRRVERFQVRVRPRGLLRLWWLYGGSGHLPPELKALEA